MSTTFLITGANRGIGLEFTQELLERGHEVIATARSAFNATGLKSLQRDYADKLTIEDLDVSSETSVQGLASRLQKRTIDTLINNAGVYLDQEADFASISLDEIKKTFDVNTLGPMRVTRALLPNLLRSSNPIVVNISSQMGSIKDNQSGGAYAYRISKAALNMLTKSFSHDYKDIISICVHPGWVQTDMGGANALITPEESVHGLLQVIGRLKKSDSGSFFNFKDQEVPW